jgi:hypothetical protein
MARPLLYIYISTHTHLKAGLSSVQGAANCLRMQCTDTDIIILNKNRQDGLTVKEEGEKMGFGS